MNTIPTGSDTPTTPGWIRFIDRILVLVIPASALLIFTVFIAWSYSDRDNTSVNALAPTAVLSLVAVLVGLVGLYPVWTWLTRSRGRNRGWRRVMRTAPSIGAGLALVFTGVALTLAGGGAYGLTLVSHDLNDGPVAHHNVRCTTFQEGWYARRNSQKPTVILTLADGTILDVHIMQEGSRTWEREPAKTLRDVCSSGETFTVNQWANTGAIAGVERTQ